VGRVPELPQVCERCARVLKEKWPEFIARLSSS